MKLREKLGGRTISVEVLEQPRGASPGCFEIILGANPEKRLQVQVLSRTDTRWTIVIQGRVRDLLVYHDGDRTWVDWDGRSVPVVVSDVRQGLRKDSAPIESSGTLKAQMPGKIVKVYKKAGDSVEVGDGMVVIEAMKMQNELKAPRSGKVTTCNVVEGQAVEGGKLLFEIE